MKVLVVGARGVLGRALVPRVVDAGYVVLAASRRPGLDLLQSDLGPAVEGGAAARARRQLAWQPTHSCGPNPIDILPRRDRLAPT